MENISIRRVYVWQTPVRFYHWLNAIVVVALAITGYIIGSPPAIQSGSEASFGYWFGTVRFIHFLAAFLFFFNFLFRIYWSFVGNDYAKWHNFIVTKNKQWKEMLSVLKIDVFQREGKPIDSVGHNSLAGFVYFISFLAFLFQCMTGFGMYSAMSNALLPNMFAWVVPFMGGDFAVRQWHHVMMWFFIIFSMGHIYLVFYHDYVEGRGIMSSMVGGWKFVEKKSLKK